MLFPFVSSPRSLRRRKRVWIATSTLSDWVSLVAFLLACHYHELIKEALKRGFLYVDGTTMPVQDRSKILKHHRGYYWVYRSLERGFVWMEYRKGRDQKSCPTPSRGHSRPDVEELYWRTSAGLWVFGAVPAVVVPDNLKAAVKKAHRYDPEINPTYQEMYEHYDLVALPARTRKPRKTISSRTASAP